MADNDTANEEFLARVTDALESIERETKAIAGNPGLSLEMSSDPHERIAAALESIAANLKIIREKG